MSVDKAKAKGTIWQHPHHLPGTVRESPAERAEREKREQRTEERRIEATEKRLEEYLATVTREVRPDVASPPVAHVVAALVPAFEAGARELVAQLADADLTYEQDRLLTEYAQYCAGLRTALRRHHFAPGLTEQEQATLVQFCEGNVASAVDELVADAHAARTAAANRATGALKAWAARRSNVAHDEDEDRERPITNDDLVRLGYERFVEEEDTYQRVAVLEDAEPEASEGLPPGWRAQRITYKVPTSTDRDR